MSTWDADVIRLELPATYYYLSLVSTTLAEMLKRLESSGNDWDALLYNVQLATHEVCTNIVDHAYGERSDGRIVLTLTLERQPARITVDLFDTGVSFDVAKVAAPNLDEAQEQGYGLFLIYNLMDSVSYSPSSGGNHWTLVKYL
jgi:serine/threonine-protein kinase RsbW